MCVCIHGCVPFWGCVMVVCPFGNECWYSWLCARLGICVYALMLNLWCTFIWFVINIWFACWRVCRWGQHEVRTLVEGATCLYWFVIIWFVRNIWFVGWGVCRWGQHEVRTDATCLYWIVLIWFVMNIWTELWIVIIHDEIIYCCICICLLMHCIVACR